METQNGSGLLPILTAFCSFFWDVFSRKVWTRPSPHYILLLYFLPPFILNSKYRKKKKKENFKAPTLSKWKSTTFQNTAKGHLSVSVIRDETQRWPTTAMWEWLFQAVRMAITLQHLLPSLAGQVSSWHREDAIDSWSTAVQQRDLHPRCYHSSQQHLGHRARSGLSRS